MYRGKRQFPRQVAKAMAKEVSHTGTAVVFNAHDAEQLPRAPRVVQPTRQMAIAQKAVKKAQPPHAKKVLKKVSKRTNTGGFPEQYTVAAHVHPEGKRWVKTLGKQAKTQRIVSTRHAAKRRSA